MLREVTKPDHSSTSIDEAKLILAQDIPPGSFKELYKKISDRFRIVDKVNIGGVPLHILINRHPETLIKHHIARPKLTLTGAYLLIAAYILLLVISQRI